MKLLKQIGLTLPILRKSQACEACGETFACEISLGKGCWCGEIKLSDETRQELRAKYKKCLCRACLEKVAASNSTSEVKTVIEHLSSYPRRIICLTEETTETLYLLGEQERIVGVSGYTVRPAEARLKPKVSAFINAKFDKILALEPDLVFAFSDLQADIAAELIRRGVTVMTFNQRSIAEILEMILTVGRIVGCAEKARSLVLSLQTERDAIRQSAVRFSHRPRVLFEEWYDPLISGIRWVDELIEIAGGECIFSELRKHQAAKDRIVNPADVIGLDPEVIIGSWCGRAVKKEWIRKRVGWNQISAIRNNHIYEVKSAYILQPGPAALTEGLRQLHAILAHAVNQEIEQGLLPKEKTDVALGLPPPQKPVEHAAV